MSQTTREFALTALALLREVGRRTEGDLETVRENVATAITATQDAIDALDGAEQAEVAALEAMWR